MARVKRKKETSLADWQVIFCSLTIILVAFFVMLCSYASPAEQKKMVAVRRSFNSAVGIFSGGILFEKGEGILAPSPDNLEQKVENIISPIHRILQGKGFEDKIRLQSTDKHISMILFGEMLFHEGSAELTSEAKFVLEKISEVVRDFSVPMSIEGHTDDIMVKTGRYSSNWELSAMRAVNVMKFFNEAGISSGLISAAGFAQYKPFVPNRTDEDRKMNRRVEIIIPIVGEAIENRGGGLIRDPPPSFKVWSLKG